MEKNPVRSKQKSHHPQQMTSAKKEQQSHLHSRKSRDADKKTFMRDPGLLFGGLFLYRENRGKGGGEGEGMDLV